MEFKGSEEEKELKVALKHGNQQHGRNEANRRTVSLYTKKTIELNSQWYFFWLLEIRTF